MCTETVLGVQTKTFGFHGKFKRRSLFIMNHVTHLDWLYFWSVVGRHGDLLTWKVVTKNNIRHLPLLGVCVCVCVCVCVRMCVCECVCVCVYVCVVCV